MNNPFNNLPPAHSPEGNAPGSGKKRKLWRNLFLLNLGISLVLVGIFWLPVKLVQMQGVLDKPSVNLPQKGEMAQKPAPVEKAPRYENMLETRYALINASSDEEMIYFDFSRGGVVRIHDPSSLEWDLAFRRSKVISNGGATNKFGQAGLVDLGTVDFDAVAEVPLDDYVQDSATRTETQNPVLLKWYKYNYLTHKLTAKKNIYAVRTADKKFAKVQFISFYCDNKETGCIRMRYVYQDNGSNSFLKTTSPMATSVAANPASGNF